MKAERLYTSESVSEGHPDKLADQISDALLDGFFDEARNQDRERGTAGSPDGVLANTRAGSPSQYRKVSRWWIDMIQVDSDRPPSAHGIQCGIARISIVASTGSPRSRRSNSRLAPRTAWSYRMF